MDSVTQFALGAVIGAVALAPKIGARNAIIVGGVMGTLPDLDTFLPSDDPVSAFTSHRGATHSLIVQAIAAPFFAEPLVRLFKGLREHRIFTYLAIYMIFATHALIDAITIYGTRLFYPVVDTPFGVGSMFIIDPFYSLPLIVIVLWGLAISTYGTTFARWAKRALMLTSAYMLLSIPLQQMAEAKALQVLEDRSIEPEQVLTVAGPFSIFYWKTIAIDGNRYINLYSSTFGNKDAVTAYVHSRRADLIPCLASNQWFQDLSAFNKDIFNLAVDGTEVVMSDLRMGLSPNYVFSFAIAEAADGGMRPLEIPVRRPVTRSVVGDWDWLFAGIAGSAIPRPAEASFAIALDDLGPIKQLLAMTRCAAG
jgi:inner membrane protein